MVPRSGPSGPACQFDFVEWGPEGGGRLLHAPPDQSGLGQGGRISFWVKGDGSKDCATLGFVGEDQSVIYEYWFSIESTDWRKLTVPWCDFMPVTPQAHFLNTPHGGHPLQLHLAPLRQVRVEAGLSGLQVHRGADLSGARNRRGRRGLHARDRRHAAVAGQAPSARAHLHRHHRRFPHRPAALGEPGDRVDAAAGHEDERCVQSRGVRSPHRAWATAPHRGPHADRIVAAPRCPEASLHHRVVAAPTNTGTR